MDLLLRDTLSGRAQPVRRRPGRPVSLYVCGPTVYDGAHVGHARTYLFFDLVRRHLEAEGIPVRHVMNVTNFEDKIDARAAELGLGWRSLALREEAGFLRDLRDLRILTPHVRPRASAFVPQMTDVARRLARTGRVHRQGDEWLYSPPNRPAGANFLTGKELGSHAVEEPDHPFPLDDASAGEFMVWKLQDRPRPSWPGPWGRGTPGWHLECYAMAHELLGLPVDVHGGGTDLIFPHHYAENEVALALNHRPFARLFVHPGLVLWEGSKMSKSKGNLVPLRTATQEVGPDALRWYLLGRPLTDRFHWTGVGLHRAASEWRRIYRTLRTWLQPGAGGRVGAVRAREVATEVRRDLAADLATDRVFDHLRAWVSAIEGDPSGHVPHGERGAAAVAVRDVERRTGLKILV
ncbi:MAG: class I tRNA ligase family protein [Thermoplasmata archaeon]